MFYRRKILLALLEAFGGSLDMLDCQKLLLLLCLRRGKQYYDFFPHATGNKSFILVQDHNRLIDLGLLAAQDNFHLAAAGPYIDQVQAKDRAVLYALAAEIGALRGEALLHKAALEAPHYFSYGPLGKPLFSNPRDEYLSANWTESQEPTFFTIGYEGLSIDAYLGLLISNNVAALIDVRKNPISMKYGFSKKKLSYFLSDAGITYIHVPELGIPSNLRHDLQSESDYRQLFNFYSEHILPEQSEQLTRLKQIAKDDKRVAITCFEADHMHCHRHRIAAYLANEPDFHVPIIHLHSEDARTINQESKNARNGLLDRNTLYSSV
ncbi:hypothetical protein KDH_12140 [Dictyobacter sp. S3.2.2.5]|uniref:DUF488 domain-containing protein n=1 Tax=Dictyobacter halimunensis TaxID=3026934 RepID=A0ABQ6FM77_9CHLR|nr:hypothetical protein KDH_12140 [Dictyobacter sp. S3.2.2.5]